MTEFPVKTKKIREIHDLLKWYADIGVETAISASPTNWLKPEAKLDRSPLERLNIKHLSPKTGGIKPQKSAVNAKFLSSIPADKPPVAAPLSIPSLDQANESAAKAKNLNELRAALEGFEGCALKRTAKNLVFYRGADAAPLMIIGEAPGRDEDIAGSPFVGRAGQLLDKMLGSIGYNEENTHITNIVYWRPPGNRTPTEEEGQICRPFLMRQIELVAPKIILLVGGSAAKQMLETTTGIMKLRGKWKTKQLAGQERKLMSTLHPAYLLRTPIAKRLAWQDLQIIKSALDKS